MVSGSNKIVSGKLDVELEYQNAAMADFAPVTSSTDDLFVAAGGQQILWEPGVAAVVYLKLSNPGSLAARYKLAVAAQDTVTGADGAALSKVLKRCGGD